MCIRLGCVILTRQRLFALVVPHLRNCHIPLCKRADEGQRQSRSIPIGSEYCRYGRVAVVGLVSEDYLLLESQSPYLSFDGRLTDCHSRPRPSMGTLPLPVDS